MSFSINFDFDEVAFERSIREQLEGQLREIAQSASAMFGGVQVEFERNARGEIQSIHLAGSDAAIAAAYAALASQGR